MTISGLTEKQDTFHQMCSEKLVTMHNVSLRIRGRPRPLIYSKPHTHIPTTPIISFVQAEASQVTGPSHFMVG